MHVVYEMGRLCCIHTPVYYSKRLCLTTWQVPSFIARCVATAVTNLVLFGGNRKVLVVDFFAGCWRVSASVHVVYGITGFGLFESHLRCHTYSTRV